MNFSKSILVSAMLSTIALPVIASEATEASEIEFFGKANVSLESVDEGDGRYSEVKSNASRLGIKGSHKLTDDLEIVYRAEFATDIDGDGDFWKPRNQFVGIKGNFGTVVLGRLDSVVKQSTSKIDLFNDLDADLKYLWAGENRLAGTVSYKSPTLSGFHFAGSYIAEEDSVGRDGYSVAVVYGDKKLKKSNLYALVSMDLDVQGQSKDKYINKGFYDVTRFAIQGKLSDFVLGAVFHTQEDVDTGASMDGLLLSAKYTINEYTLKGQYQGANHDGGDSRSAITAGVDYKFDSVTKFYAFYSTFNLDSADDKDYLAVGIEYKF